MVAACWAQGTGCGTAGCGLAGNGDDDRRGALAAETAGAMLQWG